MVNFIFKNQELLEEKDVNISINERGFLFGDGIFETCKIFNGKIYNFEAHKNRIKLGLKALKIDAEIANLYEKSQKLIAKNSIKNGVLRISISRGIGSFGYLPNKGSESLTIIQTLPKRDLPNKVTLGVSKIKAPSNIFGKTKNSLPYIMTKINACENGFFDAVILSEKNFVAETSSANIFWIKNGKIYTPSESCNIVLGTIREKLLRISPIKISRVEAKISALKNADEIFLTNASFLVLPIDEFLGRKLVKNIGNEFVKLINEDLEKLCKN